MAALPQTSEDLVRLIERSGLINYPKIAQELEAIGAPQPALRFARRLVQKELLTTFQAEQLMQGKSRGFFLGNYQVLEPLGSGGTAGVFLGEHKVMRNLVALKVLCNMRLSKDANMLLRFRREARAAATLSHPNVVRTIDFDEDEGRHFLVMEYVDGQTLEQWLRQNPNPPLKTVVSYILQAAHGLQHIHEAGLIHRDIKPSNLLLDKQGTVKILDLGLAKFMDSALQDDLSQMGGASVTGTIDFMSPEQANFGKNLDIRCDIYSLGATLYYLLSGGQVPFPSENASTKLIAIQFQVIKPLQDHRPEVDGLLQKIVERMMARVPDKRFQSPKEAITVLEGWLNRGNREASAVKPPELPEQTAVHEFTMHSTPMPIKVAPAPVRAASRKSLADVLTRSGRVKPITPRVNPSRRAAGARRAGAATKPLSETTKTTPFSKWLFRVGACVLVVSALVAFKPWNFAQRSVAQTVHIAK